MPDPTPVLTSEQTKEIEQLIEKKREEFAGAVKSTVDAAFTANRDALLTSLTGKVTEAVKGNQSVVLATVQGAKRDTDQGIVEWLKLLVPIIATTVLGLLVWGWQKNTETKIDANTKLLETQLALKQEYFKRKMDVFHEISKQMAVVYSSARSANAGNQGAINNSIANVTKFSGLLDGNKIYMTDEAYSVLGSFWQAALDFSNKKVTLNDLEEKLTAAQNRVSKELDIPELSLIARPSPSPPK